MDKKDWQASISLNLSINKELFSKLDSEVRQPKWVMLENKQKEPTGYEDLKPNSIEGQALANKSPSISVKCEPQVAVKGLSLSGTAFSCREPDCYFEVKYNSKTGPLRL